MITAWRNVASMSCESAWSRYPIRPPAKHQPAAGGILHVLEGESGGKEAGVFLEQEGSVFTLLDDECLRTHGADGASSTDDVPVARQFPGLGIVDQ